jgi:hypothetical protein
MQTNRERSTDLMQMLPARSTDLYESIEKLFQDVQLELVACEMCGDYHPPDIHLQPFTPYDAAEPEEA